MSKKKDGYLNWEDRREFDPEFGKLPEGASVNLIHSCMASNAQSDEKLVDLDTNLIFEGDNLLTMNALADDEGFEGKIDLICGDPPMGGFGYKRNFELLLKDGSIKKIEHQFELKDYMGMDTLGEYLQFCLDRIHAMYRVLSPEGNLLFVCDHRVNYHYRCLLDEVFGINNFVNQIAWTFSAGPRNLSSRLTITHYTVLWYRKSADSIFNADPIRRPYTPEQLSGFLQDENGYYAISPRGEKKYKHPNGQYPTDTWNFSRRSGGSDFMGYPGQRPEALLKDLIAMTSNEDSVMIDPFAGSGSAGVSAEALGRRWIMCDVAEGAVQTMTRRLCTGEYRDLDQMTLMDERKGFCHYRIDGVKRPEKIEGKLDARIEVHEDTATITIEHYTHDNFNFEVMNFKSLIDYVLIDTNYDGDYFDIKISDCPTGRNSSISGTYEIPLSSTGVPAIEIIDIFGNITRMAFTSVV